jgi:predicted transcriptional regulator with HTH domain
MNKIELFKSILDFLPELFPPDLSAITLSNCTHFVGIWGRPGNQLGEALKKMIYPGKALDSRVMLGQVMMHKKKITKYYNAQESIAGLPYLAVGVPLYEGNEMVGGICVVREETILEVQNRCRSLLKIQEILACSMANVSARLDSLINSYDGTRKIADYTHKITQKAFLLSVDVLLEASCNDNCGETLTNIANEIQNIANESRNATEKIVALLNDFDFNNADLLSSIRQIETVVTRISNSVNDIMDYLTQQTNSIIKGK